MNTNSERFEPADTRMRRSLQVVGSMAFAAALLIGFQPATAQETRAETIVEQQAGKGSALVPPPSNRAERVIDRLQRWGFVTGEPRGFYPWLGSVFPGGGIAAGAGVRTLFGDDGAVNVSAGSSLNQFTRAEATVALPTFAQNRARLAIAGRYVAAPDVRYHGIGNDTQKGDRTYFGYTPSSGGTSLDVDGGQYVSVGGGVSYLHFETSSSRSGPSIEQRFSATDTPGLDVNSVNFINSTVRAAFDWRRVAGYSGSGGLYRVQFDDYRSRTDDDHSFRSFEAEVRQLVPLVRANWVLAFRGLATVTDVDAGGGGVPFFLLPSLGGGTTRSESKSPTVVSTLRASLSAREGHSNGHDAYAA